MTVSDQSIDPTPHSERLDPSERIHVEARAEDGLVIVTDQRLMVARRDGRYDLDIRYESLRRIQFDIERTRPAVLVILPERPSDPPQVLSIPPDQFEVVGQALAVIGERLHSTSPTEGTKTDMSAVGDGGQVYGG
jgi:hypothetical protein